jgi:hypothetical protein
MLLGQPKCTSYVTHVNYLEPKALKYKPHENENMKCFVNFYIATGAFPYWEGGVLLGFLQRDNLSSPIIV